MFKLGNKGIVLFVVLMTVVMVIILGTIVLGVMLSQNRFSHHKVSRIQAYYASLAGLRYGSEMLRQYDLDPLTYAAWVPTDSGVPLGTGTNTVCALLCRNSGCTSTLCSSGTWKQTATGNTIHCPLFACPISVPTDPKLPGAINAVVIVIGESHTGSNNTRDIKADVDYTAQ